MKYVRQQKAKRAQREAKKLARKDRLAWIMVALTVAGLAAYFWMLGWGFAPRAFPDRLVKAQVVHARAKPSRSHTAGTIPGRGSDLVTAGPVSKAPCFTNIGGYYMAGFSALSSFPIIVTDQMASVSSNSEQRSSELMQQIPPDVKALDEKPVSLQGFMLPVRLNGSLTTDFLLLKNQMLCCYGSAPRITEWVDVRMPGKGVKVIMDQPLIVCGTFHVGEFRENGELVGVYRLDGDMVRSGGE